MSVRWKKILPILVGSSVVILGSLPATKFALNAIHQYQVQQADGYWCVQITPDGLEQTIYGAENCRIPE